MPDYLGRLRYRLLELGCPPDQVGRLVSEVGDHRDDLIEDGLREGLSGVDAEERAGRRLGNPLALAEELMLTRRRASWLGRHSWLAFGLLPVIAYPLLWASFLGVELWLGAGVGFGWDSHRMHLAGDDPISFRRWAWLGHGADYLAVGLPAFLFCWLARRSAVGWRWIFIACAVCSFLAGVSYIHIGHHDLSVGATWSPHWMRAMVPLAVFGAFWGCHWRVLWGARRQITKQTMRILILLLACLPAMLVAGCASEKREPLAQRGWIGGEYVLAKRSNFWNRSSGDGVACTLPPPLQAGRRAAIQITRLSPNTPAGAAGLRANDFIVELNHRAVASLADFRRAIDRSKPGTALVVKAWHNDRFMEVNVPVGREKYKLGGYITLCVPTVVHRWDLWPDPGFSLVCVGYEPNPGLREELASHPGKHDVYNEDWKAYVAFLEISRGERVTAQESVVAAGLGGR